MEEKQTSDFMAVALVLYTIIPYCGGDTHAKPSEMIHKKSIRRRNTTNICCINLLLEGMQTRRRTLILQ